MPRIPPEFKVFIPDERIALYPPAMRGQSRLLVIERESGRIVHVGGFHDLVGYIAGDLIILNDTRVNPARVRGVKPSGGAVDVLFVDAAPASDGLIHALINPARRLKAGMILQLPGGAALELVERDAESGWMGRWSSPEGERQKHLPPLLLKGGSKGGSWGDVREAGGKEGKTNPPLPPPSIEGGVRNDAPSIEGGVKPDYRVLAGTGAETRPPDIIPPPAPDEFASWLERWGDAPLPPYIRRAPETSDRGRYQTVYAQCPGSIAAPTAGLHFTDDLLDELQSAGCELAHITLDVGIGTFTPIRDKDLRKHSMHRERYTIPKRTANCLRQARESGRHVTSVGTTVVRALESAAAESGEVAAGEGWAELFIHPPYQMRATDRLITNFHRPDSTLIQLTAALLGWEVLNEAYQRALDEGFRFYSYGDAMLIL